MTENKMPNEIHVYSFGSDYDGQATAIYNESLGTTPYTRTDLYTSLERKNARLVEALEEVLNNYEGYEFNPKTQKYDIPIHSADVLNIAKQALAENKE